MAVRARRNAGTSWRRALGVSLGLHALLLLAIGVGASATSAGVGAVSSTRGTVVAVPETATMVDLAAVDLVPGPELTSAPTSVQPIDLSTAPPADQARAVSNSVVARAAGGVDRRSPAPDRGTDRGRVVEDPAWRRDATTLHERLTDGAETYQPSHARTASRATSPQAVRREPVAGLGDSTETHHAQRAAATASYGVVDLEGLGLGAATLDGVATVPPVAANPAVPEAQHAILVSSQGPLAAEQGARSFDVEAPGFVAGDNRAQRQASHEDHPGITDLTVAAVSGNGAAGRGPSDTPGAVTRVSGGAAPSSSGARGASATLGDDQSTQERRYDRYKQEIRDRVDRERIFPQVLKLQLEQGETLLHFVVLPDGSLGSTIQITKSSGFAEFDRAALDAVRKASPFRPMPDAVRAKALGVTLRVGFPNPVIR